MKNSVITFCGLLIFCSFMMVVHAQQYPKAKKMKPPKEQSEAYSDDDFDKDDWKQYDSWQRNGFEFFIGSGIYFGSKKTANYYNGAPGNEFGLDLLFNNEYRNNEVLLMLKNAYHHIDTAVLFNDFNKNSKYNIAMDIALGARYRFQKNWYVELCYSFRRLTAQNRFSFEFPGGIPGNKENPPYSGWENLLAKENRHYIDLSVGYVFHNHPIAKPFIAVGAMFNYIEIKKFLIFIENDKVPAYDFFDLAKYPNYVPNLPQDGIYKVWAAPGYGFSLTAGLKIAINASVSLDPVFQMSVSSFGNGRNLPGFYTGHCFNYMAGIRIVMCDAAFVTFGKKENTPWKGGNTLMPVYRSCRSGNCSVR